MEKQRCKIDLVGIDRDRIVELTLIKGLGYAVMDDGTMIELTQEGYFELSRKVTNDVE